MRRGIEQGEFAMPQQSARTGHDRRQDILKRTLEGLEADLEGLREHLGESYEVYEQSWAERLKRLPRWVDVQFDEVRPLLSIGEEDGLYGVIGPHLVALVAGEIEQFVARWLGARGQLVALDMEDKAQVTRYREEAQALRRQLDTLSRLIDRASKQVPQQLATLRDDILADIEAQRVRDTEALEQLVGSGALERGRDARAEIARLWEEQRRNAEELSRAWSQLDQGVQEGVEHMQRGLAELRSLLKRAQDGLYVVYPSLLAPERAISAVAQRRAEQPALTARAAEPLRARSSGARPRAVTTDIAPLKPLARRPAVVEDEFDPYKMGTLGADDDWPAEPDWSFDESPEPPVKRTEDGPLVDFFEEDDSASSVLYVSTVGGASPGLGLKSNPLVDEGEVLIAPASRPATKAARAAAATALCAAPAPSRIAFAEEFSVEQEESAPIEMAEEVEASEEILDEPLYEAPARAQGRPVSAPVEVEERVEPEDEAAPIGEGAVEDEAVEVAEEAQPTLEPAPAAIAATPAATAAALPREAARPQTARHVAAPEPVFAPCVRRRKGSVPVSKGAIALTIGLPLAIAGGIIAAAAASQLGAQWGNPLAHGVGMGAVAALLAWAMLSPWIMRWQVRWRGVRPELSQRAMVRDEVQLEATEEYVALGPWEMPWEELDEVARERWIEAEGAERGWLLTLQHPTHGIHMIAAVAEDERRWSEAGTPIVRVPPGAWRMAPSAFMQLEAQVERAQRR
jgi:hypothetical protein